MIRFLMLATFLVGSSESARILTLVQSAAKSHWIVIEPLLRELAARGHQVTVFSSFPQDEPLKNYTDVDMSHKRPTSLSAFSFDFIKDKMPNPWRTASFLYQVGERACSFLKEPEFQDLLQNEGQYDLVITELFGNDCFTYFAYKLKVPFISYTSSMAMPWAAERLGLPDNPSYIPNYLVNFSPKMNLYERAYNAVLLFYSKFLHHNVLSRQTRSMVEEAFGEPLPPLHQVVANTSLLFVNSFHVLSQSRPFPPNVVEVGGIHIKERKPLPEDLKRILDESKNGVILMSFGSLVRSSTLPKSTIKMFMRVFAKIPQTVIFKYEDDLPGAPKNVILRSWLPQRDMIEHKNVMAVIAHGGLASTIEAVYFGKPLIGIPFYSDQFVNIRNLVSRGGGLQLDLDDLTVERIATAVHEIINNTKYTEGMRRLSQQYRDRPQTALQSAVYWTEYVIRHQGAPHLRPESVRLPLYQYLLLDVLALLVTSAVTLIYVTYHVIRSALAVASRVPLGEFRDWVQVCDRFCVFKHIFKLYGVVSSLLKRYQVLSLNSKRE